ncbi:MAG TPA: amino acid adenylation domain-containing protein, partial [Chitinispirillaceae bacterium]|nr:amino acid adenylation domain-containing protein [Chitinispirillaceae bacterium]
LSPDGLKQKIIKDRIAVMWLTSSLCNIFADEEAEMFKPLRKLFTGGEALSPAHIKKIAQACPELEIYNGYGPTENTTFTTVHKLSDRDFDGSPIPIGRPIPNTRVYIVDENLQIVAPGQWGEICAAGDGLALKYIGRDDLTREAFIHLPAPANERVYRTGDKGRWRNDGVIEFGGRIDGQVKIRGYRIEMSEIENRINRFPGITGSAVVSLERDNEIHLIAFIKSENRNSDDLLEYLRKYLPEYMIPQQFEYIDKLPFTSNGKLDRKELKTLLQHKLGDVKKTVDDNSIEIKLLNIFSDILGETVDSTDSDFFQLGGHSLKALKLLNRIRKEICKDIDFRTVMENSTPSKLAKMIQAGSRNIIIPQIKQMHSEECEFIPLSSAQKRMWFLQKLQPESTVYTIPFAARIKSEIELKDIQTVFSSLEHRHDALRFRMPDKIIELKLLKQKITPPGSLIVRYHDFSNMTDAEERVTMAICSEREKPFKFGYDEPLIRLFLFRIKNDESILFVNIHHIIFDGVSASVILNEFLQALHTVRSNCTASWKELPLQYSDYVRKNSDDSEAIEEMKKRWIKRLMPLPETLQFPYDMKRPQKQTFNGSCYNFSLIPEISDGIVKLANNMHLTVFTVLLSMVKVLIYRHTFQKEFFIGVPAAGRSIPELEEMVGLFVNTIPVRCSIEPNLTFRKFIEDVSERLIDALSDQDLPLEDMINSMDLPRNEMRNPLFDILVAMEDSSWHINNKSQYMKIEHYSLPVLHSRMDISFYFHMEGNEIKVSIEYSTDLFYHETICKIAERFTQLAQSSINDPGTSLSSLDMLPLSEREQIVHGFNSTHVDFDTEHSIDELFIKTVSKNPDSVALRDYTGNILSYNDLDRRVDSIAVYLNENGVGKAAHVALCLERSFDLISAIFAILRIGAVYVPVPPGIVNSRIRPIIEDCKDLVVLTNNQFYSLFSGLNVKVLRTDDVPETKSFNKEPISPREIAYLIYTSGSTGRPKGVMIRHNSVLNRILWMQSRFPLTENDVILQKTPISFDVSIWELFWWSWTGASLVLLEPSGEGNPAIIVDAISKSKVTVIHFVPSMLRLFLEYLNGRPESISKISSLRYVFVSGEALTTDLVELFNTTIYNEIGCELHNLYGPTEATVDVTWYPCTRCESLTSIPIGKPVANTQIYILDQFKNPLPAGVKGEIHLGGIQVAAGYINQPTLTSEKFVDDPFNPGNKLYRTGDLGYWNNNGEVEYSGRMDFQVKLRGFRVELGEIEQALSSLDMISTAVVMVRSINRTDSLEAYLKLVEGTKVGTETIRKSLRNRLPEYMIPYVYHIVENIPLSVNGKVDRNALAKQKVVTSKLSSPDGKKWHIHNEVMRIWKLVLPEDKEIKIDQNFFEMGGNSLLLIRLHELLDNKWPGVFTPADLFVATTIERQAEKIENLNSDKSDNNSDSETHFISRRNDTENDAVAIIGLALRLSDYDQIENFWADLLAGADRQTSLSPKRRKECCQIANALSYPGDIKNITKAAFLDDISGFDNRRFALSPSDAELLDPEHRLFMETVNRCMEDAGYGGNCLDGCRVGVFAGAVVNNSYKDAATRS